MSQETGLLYNLEFKGLGTDISIRIVHDAQTKKAESAGAYLQKFYADQEKIFSRFDQASELSILNSHVHGRCADCTCENCTCEVSPAMQEVATLSVAYHEKSQGLFDPRIIEYIEQAGYRADFKSLPLDKIMRPTKSRALQKQLKEQLNVQGNSIRMKARMDFSGLAKGYITDKAAEYLAAAGWQNFLVDSGGDMYLAGRNSFNNPWCISLEGAHDQKLLLQLSDCAIATSGISRRKWEGQGKRFHHLINPEKPDQFNFDLRSVTVVADSVVEADIWAKVLFLKGREAGLQLANEQELKCIFLDYSGAAYISEAIKRNIFNHK